MSMPSFSAVVMLLGLVPALEASEKQILKVYPVADLVVPISGLPGWNSNKVACPATVGCAANCAIKNKVTCEDALIKLIAGSVKPASWSHVGGTGSIEYFPLGMGLVVRQSEDVHRELAVLLDGLRRLQDTEVSMDIRVISVPESFCYERIGIDFNVNTAMHNFNIGRLLDSGTIEYTDYRVTVGNGLRIAVPLLGPNPVGLDFGFPIQCGACDSKQNTQTFFTEKQMASFLDAVQGDRRANVMQAPKLTIFNGQQATIQVGETQNFVTSTVVKEVNGQMVAVPKTESHFLGTRLEVQGVVSADQRFVAIELKADLSQLHPTVPLFPVTIPVYPVDDRTKKLDPVTFTQFIQQPSIQKLTAAKSGNIPDGGTMMFVAGKRMVETRNEYGPPVLSKIPYMNRLFKNVGYAKEAETVLICVTPRVIVNAEETVKATGCCGTATSALIRGCVGSNCEKSESNLKACPSSNPQKSTGMNLADVVALTASGVSDEIIITQIHTTQAQFTLATEDILFLKRNKVSDQVVIQMQHSRNVPQMYPQPAQPYELPMPLPAYAPVLPYGPAPLPSYAPVPAYGPAPAYPSLPSVAPTGWSPPCPNPTITTPIAPVAPLTIPHSVSRSETAGEVGELLVDALVGLVEATVDVVEAFVEFLTETGRADDVVAPSANSVEPSKEPLKFWGGYSRSTNRFSVEIGVTK